MVPVLNKKTTAVRSGTCSKLVLQLAWDTSIARMYVSYACLIYRWWGFGCSDGCLCLLFQARLFFHIQRKRSRDFSIKSWPLVPLFFRTISRRSIFFIMYIQVRENTSKCFCTRRGKETPPLDVMINYTFINLKPRQDGMSWGCLLCCLL